ncbi:MAG: hypothetical protein FJZ58_06025, partial [Chlamydiae bacterium]|nr:hypothetical protein [Chlamydiota bacterium]
MILRWVWVVAFALYMGMVPILAKEMEPIGTGLAARIPAEGGRAGYLALPKDQPIDNTTYLYVKYALASFIEEGVHFVLLDLDTPGGEVFSALRIVEELRKIDVEHNIPVIALVDNWAISAGALLAYACRWIGVTEQASMGAAEPVIVSSGGDMETASEKMVSALRVEFAKTAKIYGRNPYIAEAMVDRDVLLVQRGEEILSIPSEAFMEKRDILIKAKGKLLTLDAEQLQKFGVADFLAGTGGVEPLTGEKILMQEPFIKAPLQWFSYTNWKISFFSFLSHPFVSSLLIMGFVLGLYSTLQSQTLSLFSLVGCICLGFILLSTFSTQLVGVLELVILFLGLGFLAVDLVFLGFGLLGGIGLLMAVGGVFALLLPSMQDVSFSLDFTDMGVWAFEWFHRLTLFMGSLVLAFIGVLFLSRWAGKRKLIARRLILADTSPGSMEVEELPPVGSAGEAISDLRPQGKVQVGGKRYQARTEGEF